MDRGKYLEEHYNDYSEWCYHSGRDCDCPDSEDGWFNSIEQELK